MICGIITSRNITKSKISMFRRTLYHNTTATFRRLLCYGIITIAFTQPFPLRERRIQMAKRETVWIANLYLRLSKEDKRSANAESISIETQRMKTSNFANNNNIIIRKEYVDDGESGVFFAGVR